MRPANKTPVERVTKRLRHASVAHRRLLAHLRFGHIRQVWRERRLLVKYLTSALRAAERIAT